MKNWKKILAVIGLGCASFFTLAAGGNVGLDQRNATDDGWVRRVLPTPASVAVMYYNTVTSQPGYATLGGNLALAGDVLNTTGLGTSSFSGAYADLTGKPTIPAAQVNSDWSASSGVSQILNKPTIATVQTTRLTTGTGGTLTWTFGTPFAQTPTVQITAQDTTAGSYINHKITAVSPTGVSIQVDRTAATVVALLGLTILSVQAPGATTVHLTAAN